VTVRTKHDRKLTAHYTAGTGELYGSVKAGKGLAKSRDQPLQTGKEKRAGTLVREISTNLKTSVRDRREGDRGNSKNQGENGEGCLHELG